ncbi:MAG: homogentisate 1,2-dioxygenase [Phycisphaerae bacterium]|nr:homogentisate 1,2-dioxygenase [Phycisphaerae bacterium]
MAYYTKLGQLPRKRHVQFRRPDGALYSEEVFGTEGFSGPTSTLYHINPPTQVIGWNTLYGTKPEYIEQDVMRMRHLKTATMPPKGDPVTGRVVVFGNADVEMAMCVPAEKMEYFFKNAMGDECIFVHYGRGTVYTTFGTLKFGPKDYIMIPKGTIYRMVFDKRKDDEPESRFVVFETANGSHMLPPKRYLSKDSSQFLEHSPYCERDLRLPELPLTFDKKGEYEVRIKARDMVHSYAYTYHPLDVVGWDGCYYPYIFNVDDFAPIVGKLHMPPPIHQTFEGHNFVICSFCPRLLDFHPDAIPVPYNHSNLDSDEVLYYVEGNYKARKGIEQGSISLHPQGIPHGPHPGTVERSLGARETSELAVMCDTFRPLFPTKAAIAMDDQAYPRSWEGEHFPVSLGQHHEDGSHRVAGNGTTNGKARLAAKSNGKSKSSARSGRKSKGAGKSKASVSAKRANRSGGEIASTWE